MLSERKGITMVKILRVILGKVREMAMDGKGRNREHVILDLCFDDAEKSDEIEPRDYKQFGKDLGELVPSLIFWLRRCAQRVAFSFSVFDKDNHHAIPSDMVFYNLFHVLSVSHKEDWYHSTFRRSHEFPAYRLDVI